MSWDDLSDGQCDRILRKRIVALAKAGRRRRALVRRATKDFNNLKSACLQLGAWDKSISK